jgi:hypothetical protein
MNPLNLSLVVVLFAASSALAQGKPATAQEGEKVVYRKKTNIDFTDVQVEGDLTKPEGTYSLSKKRTYFKSMIKVRDNFVPELQKSVDNL